MRDIEAKLDRRRDLVDVLPARSGSMDEALLKLMLADHDLRGDAKCRHFLLP